MVNAKTGAHGVDQCIGKVTDKKSKHGLLDIDNGFNIEVLIPKSSSCNSTYILEVSSGNVWRIPFDGEYIICPYKNLNETEILEWFDSVTIVSILMN